MKPNKSDVPVTKSTFLQVTNEIAEAIAKLTETDQKIWRKILEHDEEFKKIRETVATKDDIQLILNRIDAFTQKSETTDRKMVFHDHRFKENDDKLSNHEQRISTLEKSA